MEYLVSRKEQHACKSHGGGNNLAFPFFSHKNLGFCCRLSLLWDFKGMLRGMIGRSSFESPIGTGRGGCTQPSEQIAPLPRLLPH